jgi:hypothetical protein
MSRNTFDIVILNGRPAAGKSEVIDYLKSVPLDERVERFHIGEFEEIDDFPFIAERFDDDAILEKMGQPRLISNTKLECQGEIYKVPHFKQKYFWHFFIEKLNWLYFKKLRYNPDFHATKTAIVEFARGKEHGGWKTAYPYLADDILAQAVTLYIDVSFEESMRRNKRRYNPEKYDSILQHAVPFKLMEMVYKESDWPEFTQKSPHFLSVRQHQIPYAILKNEPEITDDPAKIARELEAATGKLWNLYANGK